MSLGAAARADQANPFPSPSPVASTVPGSGGYVAVGGSWFSASGGAVPASLASSTPAPFSAVPATGFNAEIASRVSDRFVADLAYEDDSIHGDDHAIVTRLDAAMMIGLLGGRAAAGIAYGSQQRSTLANSSNGLGIAAMVMPDFTRRVSPYASLDYYPSVAEPSSTHGSLAAYRLGVAYVFRGSSGLFARLGLAGQQIGSSANSPSSLTGFQLGVGGTF